MADTDEKQIKRILPHDSETERALLGALLIYPDRIPIAREYVTEDDFYDKRYGVTFGAMVAMHGENASIDPVTLHNKLSTMDVAPEMMTLDYVYGLTNSAGISDGVKDYAQTITEKSLKRQMIRLNEDIAAACYSDKDNIDDIFNETEKKIFRIIQSRSSSEYVPIKEIVYKSLEQIEKAAKLKGAVTGVATGFVDLDRKTMGLQPSDLVLVAARPSMGKTAFVLNIAEHVITRLGKGVAIFSLEMPGEQLVKRMISMNSRVDSEFIRSGELSEGDWHEVIRSGGAIADSRLVIDDTSGISLGELRSRARKYKLEFDIDIIMIDYLQLMSVSKGSKADSRQQEISEISRGLKEIARELQVPVVALSQLSRAVESRTDKRPMLSDLRESGAIEQDADVVMFIYRDDYYNPNSDKKGISEVIIAKQRNGPIGKVELGWIPKYTKFVSLDHEKNEA